MPKDAAKEERQQLKDLARSIVLSQGNEFIKQLLRDNDLKIGATKPDFLTNMNDAIDKGLLTRAHFDAWLEEVEGWGRQHVYFHAALGKSHGDALALVQGSKWKNLLNKGSGHAFPNELTLTSIEVSRESISFLWHRATEATERKSKMDKEEEWIDGELYQFHAYQVQANRAVVRFEWRFDGPYSAVFLQLPNDGALHRQVLKLVQDQLREIGLIDKPLARVPLGNAAKVLGSDSKVASAKSQTMHTHGGYVMLVSTTEGGIDEVEAVREARKGVDAGAFQSADGKYGLPKTLHDALEKDIKIEIFGAESRVRIWVGRKKADVYYITDLLWHWNNN